MGWSEGQGLGRAKQGITEPIKVSFMTTDRVKLRRLRHSCRYKITVYCMHFSALCIAMPIQGVKYSTSNKTLPRTVGLHM